MTVRDEEIAKYLDGVVGVVDANSYEKLCLWKEEHRERGTPWVETGMGYLPTIGKLDGRPVCLSLFTAIVNGKKLLFIDPTSQVVDHLMIDAWLLETLPASAKVDRDGETYVNRTNAMNFTNILR